MFGEWKSKSRGVALIAAVFFGLLCLGLSTAFLLQLPVDLSATSGFKQSTEASYIADAAITDTMAWISHELANNREPCTMSNPTPWREGDLGEWSWTCRVEPDSGTPPNGLTQIRLYRLTGTASRQGEERYRIVADVQAGQSFSRFAIFIDREQPVWPWYDFIVAEVSKYRGPIHKNRGISFKVSPSLLATAPPDGPIFNSTISTSENHHVWTVGTTSSTTTSLSSDAYDNILENGEADLLYSVPPRPLPSSSQGLANAAWGGLAPSAPPSGITVSPAGGVFIAGDVDRMEMSQDGNGNFVLTIDCGGQVTTVVEDTLSNQRLVSGPTGSTTVAGLGSGVIFATGDIASLRGVNKGPHTIANRFEEGKAIEITGSLTRADTPIGTEPVGTADRLGIVTNKIWIAPHSVLPRNQANPLFLYATFLATDTFWVRNYNGEDGAPPGSMAIYGGLSTGLPWRTVRVTGTNYHVVAGYGSPIGFGSAPILYDKLMANEPPPEYPATAGTELMVRAWREKPL